MRQLTVCLAALSLTLLAGCGGKADDAPVAGAQKEDAAAGAPSSTSEASDTNSIEVRVENMIADCMKAKGFQYIAHPRSYGGDSQVVKYASLASLMEPADQVRAFRAKYGFGVYSRLVFPNDPAVVEPEPDPDANPNKAIHAALDPAQQKAYDIALYGTPGGMRGPEPTAEEKKAMDKSCSSLAAAKHYGTGPSKEQKAAASREYAKFKNDPAVLAAAQKYADCLKGKGYRVTRAEPGFIEQSMFTAASEKLEDPGKVSADAARSGLTNEIRAALDDLDCRTEYATIARTKYASAVRAGNGEG